MTEHFTTTKYGTDDAARKACRERAKQLRAEGFRVSYKKWDFTDLARCRDFVLTARKADERG